MASEQFKRNLSLREIPLKTLLKTYIVANVVNKYITIGVRVLWKEKMEFRNVDKREYS